MKALLFLFISTVFISQSKAQNLIIDGGFENVDCPDNLINSFDSNENWYTTGADAYLINFSCPFDPLASASIEALKPFVSYGGSAHFSLESILSGTGYIISEGIATELSEPLIPNDFYYFDMAYMNYNEVITPDYENNNCDPLVERAMHVLVGENPIKVTGEVSQTSMGLLITDLEVIGEKTLSTSQVQPGISNNVWYSFWDCFQANGKIAHIGVVGEHLLVDPPNNCSSSTSPDFIYSSGHAVDEIRLYRIPNEIDTSFVLCDNKNMVIDLSTIISEPYAEKAAFEWEDGFMGTKRNINQAGIYKIEMVLPCVTVPISISIQNIRCKAKIYVANIFTPNNDGNNDMILPFLASDKEIKNYHFAIYDRWGSIVYQTTDLLEGWDGKSKGKHVAQGVYSWKIHYTVEELEEDFIEYGNVLISK